METEELLVLHPQGVPPSIGNAYVVQRWAGEDRKCLVAAIAKAKQGGLTAGDIIRLYPGLHKKQIQAAVRYYKQNSHLL